jgi:hypothetical protein
VQVRGPLKGSLKVFHVSPALEHAAGTERFCVLRLPT